MGLEGWAHAPEAEARAREEPQGEEQGELSAQTGPILGSYESRSGYSSTGSVPMSEEVGPPSGLPIGCRYQERVSMSLGKTGASSRSAVPGGLASTMRWTEGQRWKIGETS